jgi:hypothetical protein
LRISGAPRIDFETVDIQSIDGIDDKTSQMVFLDPLRHVRGQKHRGVPIKIDKARRHEGLDHRAQIQFNILTLIIRF